MPTTSAEFAAQVLDALDGSGIDYAILHGEERIAEGLVRSDIDVVTSAPTVTVVHELSKRLEPNGTYCVMSWRYDVGSASLFFSNGLALDGCQIDMTFDERARGKYGFRSDKILEGAEEGVRWRRANTLDTQLYLARKRFAKRDRDGVLDAERRLAILGNAVVAQRSRELFPMAGGRQLVAARQSLRHYSRLVAEASRRLASPVGYSIYCADVERAREVVDRFDRFLVSAQLCRSVGGAREAARIYVGRLRPHLIVACGSRPLAGVINHDLPSVGDFDHAVVELVRSMSSRNSGLG